MHVPSKYVRVDKYLCGQVSDSLNEESGSPREGETADSALGSSFRYPHIEESLWIVAVHQQMDVLSWVNNEQTLCNMHPIWLTSKRHRPP